MNTTDVKDMFRSYADEDDNTFLTNNQVNLYLSQAYHEFRRQVCAIDPFIYSVEHLFTMPTSGIADLTTTTPVLLGEAAVMGTKLERILRLARINTTGDNQVIRYLDAMPSERTLGTWSYTFVNKKIITYASENAAYRLEYIPFHNVDFNAHQAYIDDLDGFHDMIPLYAYGKYAIRDGADSAQIIQESKRRLADLKGFLESGRSREGSQYVSDFDNGNF